MKARTQSIPEIRRQVETLFAPADLSAGRPPRIGVEAEFLVVAAGGDGRGVVPVADVERTLEAVPGLAGRARFSFEPGGQLELSPSPSDSVAAAASHLETLVRRTGVALDRRGIRIVGAGVDPWRLPADVPLQTPRARYQVMQRHFDTIGPAGRRMMRQTASLQVCVDRLPGSDGQRQWLAANLIGPALAAAFRTSSTPDNRTAIWLAVDPSRTGMNGTHVDARRPVDAYLGFALGADILPLPRPDDLALDRPFRTSLAGWLAAGRERPDAADVAHHLSTLFPPVRPRPGYLEVRFLDGQPPDRMAMAIGLVSILLADPVARDSAIEITGGDPAWLASGWRRSAEDGLMDHILHAMARDMVALAIDRIDAIERRWPGWLRCDSGASLKVFAAELADRASPTLAIAS